MPEYNSVGRINDQFNFRILYSAILTLKESKTTGVHYTTRKGYHIRNKVNPEGGMRYTKVQQHENW